MAESRVVASAAPRSLKASKARVQEPARAARDPNLPRPVKTSPPKTQQKREEAKPKEFSVRVRVTVVTEKDVNVKAMTKAEAKKKAAAAVRAEGDVRVLGVNEA